MIEKFVIDTIIIITIIIIILHIFYNIVYNQIHITNISINTKIKKLSTITMGSKDGNYTIYNCLY